LRRLSQSRAVSVCSCSSVADGPGSADTAENSSRSLIAAAVGKDSAELY